MAPAAAESATTATEPAEQDLGKDQQTGSLPEADHRQMKEFW